MSIQLEVSALELLHQIRESLVPVLTVGNWENIREDHDRVDLAWREDLEPGWGKPKYVTRVLLDLDESETIALAQRCLGVFPSRCEPGVQDAVWLWEAGGDRRVTAITRRAVVDLFDGHRLHPDVPPVDFLAPHAVSRGFGFADFDYLRDGSLFRRANAFDLFTPSSAPAGRAVRARHHELFEAFGYMDWPDQRFFRVIEALVHPTVRRDDEQGLWVTRINEALSKDGFELRQTSEMSGHPVHLVRRRQTGGHRRPKNLIFASTGPKPELGFSDAIDNDVIILSNAEHCLVFDETIGEDGLTWRRLADWWGRLNGLPPEDPATRRALGRRLQESLASPPERELFSEYFRQLAPQLDEALPALLPQVYLHYDPATRAQLAKRGLEQRFLAQRMDFLLLLPGGVRVILEVDGQQHYATGMHATARPSPQAYADTARGDRELRLAGYEVYRFGGYELSHGRAHQTVAQFLEGLLARHPIGPRIPSR